jgi:hypothetical protein
MGTYIDLSRPHIDCFYLPLLNDDVIYCKSCSTLIPNEDGECRCLWYEDDPYTEYYHIHCWKRLISEIYKKTI